MEYKRCSLRFAHNIVLMRLFESIFKHYEATKNSKIVTPGILTRSVFSDSKALETLTCLHGKFPSKSIQKKT